MCLPAAISPGNHARLAMGILCSEARASGARKVALPAERVKRDLRIERAQVLPVRA